MEAMYETQTPEQKIAALESAFNNFKKQVVDVTWNWDGGCKEGKREFLDALGLEAPSERYEATITLVFEDSDYDDSDGYKSWLDDRINQDIGRHLKNFEDYSINVREIRR